MGDSNETTRVDTSIQGEMLDRISPDFHGDGPCRARDLTQQEIESGLHALHLALHDRCLPLVVLVEDDYDDADLFREALKDAGVAVKFMHFRDGRQAIDFFRGKGCYSDRQRFPLPELTVLDFKLTHCSGLEILREIRSNLAEQLVVVALTCSEDSFEYEQASGLKINGWVNKSQSARGQTETVRAVLRSWLPEY